MRQYAILIYKKHYRKTNKTNEGKETFFKVP